MGEEIRRSKSRFKTGRLKLGKNKSSPTCIEGDDLFFPNLSLPVLNLDFDLLISSTANSLNFSCLVIIVLLTSAKLLKLCSGSFCTSGCVPLQGVRKSAGDRSKLLGPDSRYGVLFNILVAATIVVSNVLLSMAKTEVPGSQTSPLLS